MRRLLHLLIVGSVLAIGACDDDPLIEGVNVPPVANAGADQTVTDTDDSGDEAVNLDGSASSDSDGTIASYAWSEAGADIATGPSPTVTFAVGTHTVTLTVRDDDGASDTDDVTITVEAADTPPENTAPVAAIAEPAEGATFDEGADVTFTGSGTDAEDGALTGTSLVWISDVDGEIGTGETFTTNTLSLGDHVVTLTVTDSEAATDAATVNITIVVPNTAPTAEITEPADSAAFDEGADVTFTGSGTDAEDGDLTDASLVWTSDLDGQIGTGEMFAIDTLTAGDHVITLTATDSGGLMGTATVNITINAAPTSFMADIQPYFVDNGCTACHGATNQFAGVRLDSHAAVLTDGNNGPLVVPFDASMGILIPKLLADHQDGADDAGFANGPLTAWINEGALDN